jgi:hypothetical protein
VEIPKYLEFGNYIPQGWHVYGYQGGMTEEGETIPPSAMKEIISLRMALADVLVDNKHPLRVARARGQSFDEMRDNLYTNPLYGMGDATLIWANEGDMGLLTFYQDLLYLPYPDETT